MPDLTLTQIFGAGSYVAPIDGAPPELPKELHIWIGDFANSASGGQILNNLGLNAPADVLDVNSNDYAAKLFYGLILLILQNQADNINADPEQKIFIAEQAPRLGVGARSGQIQRSFLVSFFTDGNVASIPDIDDI